MEIQGSTVDDDVDNADNKGVENKSQPWKIVRYMGLITKDKTVLKHKKVVQ